MVSPADRLDWTVLDPFTVPAGGPWPRWLHYEGDDTGFVAWTRTRETEGFAWTPHTAQDVDLSATAIQHLSLTLTGAPVRVVLPDREYGSFTAYGDLRALTAELGAGARCPALHFCPRTVADQAAGPAALPVFPALAAARSVDVTVGPLRQPFDCASLLQFPEVRRLALHGRLTNLPALAGLRHLTGLQLRFSPDLAELPAAGHLAAAGARHRLERRRRRRAAPARATAAGVPGQFRLQAADGAVVRHRVRPAVRRVAGAAGAGGDPRVPRRRAGHRGRRRPRDGGAGVRAGGEQAARHRDGRAGGRLSGGGRLAGEHAEVAQEWFDTERDF